MNNTEYMLSGSLGNWLYYAMNTFCMEENEAVLMWNNRNNIGKKVICECRDENSSRYGTRLFIRNVTNVLEDAYKKKGWWNTFTLSKEKLKKGLYLAEIISYRLDRNGYLNAEVKSVMPVNDIAFHTLFSENSGTWRSSAWWLMMVESDAFLQEYAFSAHTSFHKPNIEELKRKFPVFKDLTNKEIGEKALYMYLKNEITMREIEECLDTPSSWEKLISDVTLAVYRGEAEDLYSTRYPLFAKKVSHNIKDGSAENYITRQLDYYNQLLGDKKIEPVTGDLLNLVEAALAYRKKIKDAEKEERKKKRKEKKLQI